MQNINFYDRSLRLRRDWFGMPVAITAVAVATVALLTVGALLQRQVSDLQRLSDESAAALEGQQSVMQAQLRAFAAMRPDAALEQRLLELQRTLESHQAALQMLRAGSLQGEAGHAAMLQALARRSIDGVWITGLALNDGELSLRGRSLRPELIPVWVDRLPLEPALKGHAFRALEIRRPEADAGPGAVAVAASEAASAPRASFVEFSLAGSRTAVAPTGSTP